MHFSLLRDFCDLSILETKLGESSKLRKGSEHLLVFLDGSNNAFSNRVLVESNFEASKNTVFEGIWELQTIVLTKAQLLKHDFLIHGFCCEVREAKTKDSVNFCCASLLTSANPCETGPASSVEGMTLCCSCAADLLCLDCTSHARPAPAASVTPQSINTEGRSKTPLPLCPSVSSAVDGLQD